MSEPAHIYILPCSARKSKDVEKGLNWEEKTKIGPWCKAWDKAEKIRVSELYTGQSFKQSLGAIRSGPKPWRIYVVSAGGGLIRGPTSEDAPEQDIPSYEVHCFPSKPMSPALMGKLWREGKYPDCEKGTWSKMDVKSGDKVVVCLSNSYQRAVLNDDFVSHLPKKQNRPVHPLNFGRVCLTRTPKLTLTWCQKIVIQKWSQSTKRFKIYLLVLIFGA